MLVVSWALELWSRGRDFNSRLENTLPFCGRYTCCVMALAVQWAETLCQWEGYRRSGIGLAMPCSKVTIRFLTTCPGKKSQFSWVARLSRFRLGVPDLSRFAHLCSHMLTHRWPTISSDFICIYKKSLVSGALPWIPLGGGLTRFPDPQVGHPSGSRMWRMHPTICAFSTCPGFPWPNW